METSKAVMTNHYDHANWSWGDLRALALHLFDDHRFEPWSDGGWGDRSRIEEADMGAYGDIYEDLIRLNILHESFHGLNMGRREVFGQTQHERDYLLGVLSFSDR